MSWEATRGVRKGTGKGFVSREIRKKRTSEVWHSGLSAAFLHRTLSRGARRLSRGPIPGYSEFDRGRWAAYLGYVGSNDIAEELDRGLRCEIISFARPL